MTRAGMAVAALLALAAAPAQAVGFGPLVASGVIDGPQKGFSFELMNPYGISTAFRVYAIGWNDEDRQDRVSIFPDEAVLGSARSRKVLVIADSLATGETYQFRVCAERLEPAEGNLIHARACSKVTARRIS